MSTALSTQIPSLAAVHHLAGVPAEPSQPFQTLASGSRINTAADVRDPQGRQQTISDTYRREQVLLHQNPLYGVSSVQFAPLIADLIKSRGYQSVSDYGAGKKRLLSALREHGVSGIEYFPYDPAFPKYGAPQSAELVCCVDVLEHCEPEFLPCVLAELRALTIKDGFFTVHCDPAEKFLSDGRNAHLIQRPVAWWSALIAECFNVIHCEEFNDEVAGAWFFVTKK